MFISHFIRFSLVFKGCKRHISVKLPRNIHAVLTSQPTGEWGFFLNTSKNLTYSENLRNHLLDCKGIGTQLPPRSQTLTKKRFEYFVRYIVFNFKSSLRNKNIGRVLQNMVSGINFYCQILVSFKLYLITMYILWVFFQPQPFYDYLLLSNSLF